jgi:hypothetical protein
VGPVLEHIFSKFLVIFGDRVIWRNFILKSALIQVMEAVLIPLNLKEVSALSPAGFEGKRTGSRQ